MLALHKLFVQGIYGQLYRLYRWYERPILGSIQPERLSDQWAASEFVRRLRMEHADWLQVLHDMDAITANSQRSLYYSQKDVTNLVLQERLIAYSLGHLGVYNMGDYPIINAPQGVKYHFILANLLLVSEADEVKSFRNEWQQAAAFIEALALTDEQLEQLISGLNLRAGPNRADRIKSLQIAFAMGEIAVVITRDSVVVPKRKGPEDLPAEYYSPKPYTLGPHEEPGYVPPENRHSGLHNQAALAPDFNTSAESFKTTRQVDMKNLSPEDDAAAEALDDQGWNKDKVKQVLKSGNNFTETPFNPGDKLYGFNTTGRPRNLDNSAYLLDEASMDDVKSKYFKQGHWDKEGVKDYLALPCFNQASTIDVMTVTKPTTGIQSTIGKATERLRYDGADGYTTGTMGKIMGGGGRQITLDTSALK